MCVWHTLRTGQGANCVSVLSYNIATRAFWKITKVSLFWKRCSISSKKNLCTLLSESLKTSFPDQVKLCVGFSHKSSYQSCPVLTAYQWFPGWTLNTGSCFPFAPGNPWSSVTCGTTYCGSHSDYMKETLIPLESGAHPGKRASPQCHRGEGEHTCLQQKSNRKKLVWKWQGERVLCCAF